MSAFVALSYDDRWRSRSTKNCILVRVWEGDGTEVARLEGLDGLDRFAISITGPIVLAFNLGITILHPPQCRIYIRILANSSLEFQFAECVLVRASIIQRLEVEHFTGSSQTVDLTVTTKRGESRSKMGGSR
jgi:hypothetical protein